MKILLVLTAMLTVVGATTARAVAQNYPWCTYYAVKGGATNCGFTTYEQCMTTLSGMGGFCALNTQYVPPPGPHLQYVPPPGPHPRSHHYKRRRYGWRD
jgi:hypothetical protein